MGTVHRRRGGLAITLFVAAVAATALCMDRSAAASPTRTGEPAATQPFLARLSINLRRTVRPLRAPAEQPTFAVVSPRLAIIQSPVALVAPNRHWSILLFCLPPPAC